MSDSGPLYNLDAARGSEQRERMVRLEAEGICIFCLEHREAHQTEPVEHLGEHWYVARNDFPYEGAGEHFLIVSRRHVHAFEELPDEAGTELWQIRRRLAERFGAVAYATVERSGDMRYNGGSVAHLHVHMVALETSPAATVRFRVSAHGADHQS
jgi:ATP adenylyltransferase